MLTYPKISILIPTFNRARYLTEAIEGALAQDYPKLEVIISDNASEDNTDEIVKKYICDKRLHYYKNKVNLGAARNWEKLICEYATGEWAIVHGSDDYLIDSTYISECAKMIGKNEDCVLCHANLKMYYEDKNIFVETNHECPLIVDGMWYFWEYKRGVTIHVSNLVFKRSLALKIDLFGGNYIGGDSEMIGKLLLNGKVAFINKVVNVYRMHASNDTYTANIDRIYNHYECYNKLYKYAMAKDSGLKEKLIKWRSRSIRMFMKTYYCTLMGTDKKKAMLFLRMSFKGYAREFIKLFIRPHNAMLLLVGLVTNEKNFKLIHEYYINIKNNLIRIRCYDKKVINKYPNI